MTFTIGEASERSGFRASALRYYEGIGLVPPSTRTDGGYRLYDESTLARLAFISRAKQLGCSLEEITDLVAVWDGERCGPVQKRFHDLVTTKLADAQRQIADLTALSDQLRHAAAQLAGPAIDGPCDDGCACLTLDSVHDAAAPIACTASSEEIPVRIDQIERLRTDLDRLERTPHGLLLHFPVRADLEAGLHRFIVDEKSCCSFWDFAIETQDDQVTLRWEGPPEVEDFFDRLVEFFEGDEPLIAMRGIL